SPMYEAVAKADPQRVLRHEWLNARGAIARFDRSAIEIRLADVQECPRADIAIAHAVCSIVQALFEERQSSAREQERIETTRLARLLLCTMRDGEDTLIDDTGYLAVLGLSARERSGRAAWQDLLNHACVKVERPSEDALSHILTRGTLASRLLRRVGRPVS